eukprot:CAMPEP_0197828804 /NCGR_PEP_ID=MMETSP1437-20131217/5331_1 /TAXON_ID=49252 ORGANISM="Eucampia antarctica, Strain CCMP1452" /NCGR_SAMPLE_ID=MMETSP1437 /ASSEMBLY_ACC=CAM_ASM_001096 /LENGTH=348 /DNA_ID=CAMNT_0043430193 /DNA_START=121 /DNA_END=1167 /DNA_ORIENTATION=+
MAAMKATIRKGIFGKLTFVEEYSKPAFDANKSGDKVLVKIDAAAINPIDFKAPRALLGTIVGLDFCGTIEEVGIDVPKHLKAGDVVYGACVGGLAEYTIVSCTQIAAPPPAANNNNSWKSTDLAALNVAYLGALQCLKKGNIILNDQEGGLLENNNPSSNNKSVLIIGASGGCGIAGIQLCKSIGVSRIVAICSGKNAQLVKEMGATEVVDYTKKQELDTFFKDNVETFDCVFDAATGSGGGEDYWRKSIPLLKSEDDGGQYTALNGPNSKWVRKMAGFQKKNETLIIVTSNTADLEMVVQLLDKTGGRPVTQIMPFSKEGLEEGMKLLKSRRAKGKIVYDMSQLTKA